MKLLFENWRTQQSWYSLQGELKEWLVSESYLTAEDVKLIEEGAISDISSFVKRKLTAAKAWTYEKYVSYVKPLLNKLIGFIKKLKEKGILKKYRARFEIEAIRLFSTKKYIKLGAVFLTAMIKVMTSGLLELPQILEKIQKVLGLVQDGAWASAADELGLPFEEIKILVGGLKGFGKDLKKTQDIFSPEKIGQGDLELAEMLDPEIIKMIQESAESVLEIPVHKMYIQPNSKKHITVQLGTNSEEHAPSFMSTIDRELDVHDYLITKEVL